MPVSAVKRRYAGELRRERARQTHERILDSAERLFFRDGYSATTVSAIAASAQVSADTIYKSFGGKPAVVHALFERALRGAQEVPAEERSDRIQVEEPDPRRIIDAWGRFVAELTPRAAPIQLLIREAAATDHEVRPLFDEMHDSRLRRMTRNAQRLHDAGHLRPGITVGEAADVLWTYSSPELYELLVIRRGVSLDRYARFVADAMTAALL